MAVSSLFSLSHFPSSECSRNCCHCIVSATLLSQRTCPVFSGGFSNGKSHVACFWPGRFSCRRRHLISCIAQLSYIPAPIVTQSKSSLPREPSAPLDCLKISTKSKLVTRLLRFGPPLFHRLCPVYPFYLIDFWAYTHLSATPIAHRPSPIAPCSLPFFDNSCHNKVM